MRLLIISIVFFSEPTFGQIVNSLSGDKTGMYYYSVDSLISSIKSERTIERIVIQADQSITNDFPDAIQGIQIVKHGLTSKYEKKDIRLGDIVFRISGLSIIRNQITLSIGTYERTKDGMPWFAQGSYIFYFKYAPHTDSYLLTKIKSGIRL